MARRLWQPKDRARRRRGKPPTGRTRFRDAHADGPALLYGWHTVKAALENPARQFRRLLATENAVRRLADDGVTLPLKPELVRPDAIDARLGPDAVHQGLLAEADPLPAPAIGELAADGVILVLDQITDPHNVGAIMRSAAAFAAKAIVTTARHSPEATGVLAKSASGALELVPLVTVQNLARGLTELRERGMPEDLLYLTMIESGLNPNAYSHAHAAGLWQFIEETGERYGLEVSRFVDERRDPIKSTAAALTYLQEMYDRFGSWYLSAAGYNTGENRVDRIVREKAGGRFGDESVFWQISSNLPSETRDYVPVMLAMGHIGKEPAKYGFSNLELQEPLAFDEMTVPGGTPLADVAKNIGVEPEVLYELNPHPIKKQTPPNREWNVRVPVVAEGQQLA